MPTDKSNADMLYSIIKQLDLKYIDWKAIAEECKISNGHAARMRYHRFRQTMENIQPAKRGPRASKGSSKRQKLGDEKGWGVKGRGGLSDDDDEEKYCVKAEDEDSKMGIKNEAKAEDTSDDEIPLSRIRRIKKEVKQEPTEEAEDAPQCADQEMEIDREVAPAAVDGQVLFKEELPWH